MTEHCGCVGGWAEIRVAVPLGPRQMAEEVVNGEAY